MISTLRAPDEWPLTAAQQGMLFDSVSTPACGMHIQQVRCRVLGPLDASAFERAWQDLFDRHSIFRMAVCWRDRDVPAQRLLPRVEARMLYRDVREEAAPLEKVDAYAAQDRLTDFDLERPPLMRLALFRTSGDEHALVWTHHHCVLDGWSLPLVFNDLLDGYEAAREGRRRGLVPSGSFADFLARNASCVPQAPLPMAAPVETTPAGRAGGQGSTARGAARFGDAAFELDVAATTRLKSAARARRVTLTTLVYGAWAAVLSRYAATCDVSFGVTTYGRAGRAGADAVIGPCLDTRTLHVHVPADEAREWLRPVQSQVLDAIARADGPGAGTPRTLVVCQNYPLDAGVALRGGLQIHDVVFGLARTRLPLVVMAVPGAALSLRVLYDASAFHRLDARAILRHFATALEGLAAGDPPSAIASRIPGDEIPLVAAPAAPRTDASPETTVERVLARAWADALGLPHVGIDQSFFDLGGDSLAAMRLVAASRAAFGVDLPLGAVFEQPTVRRLAARISTLAESRRDPVPSALAPCPESRFEPFAMTPVQQAYWIGRGPDFELGNVATHAYSEIDAAGVDLDRLERSWAALVARHDMLRAVVLADGRMQVLAPERAGAFRVHVVDLSGEEPVRVRYALEETRARMSHRRYGAGEWPLFDIRATRLAGGRVRLHFSYDLLICDARSVQVLSRELARLYRNPAALLPPLGLTFRDYRTALEDAQRSEMYSRAWDYWQPRAGSLPPPPDLPLARRPLEIAAPRFRRRRARLQAPAWHAFRGAAARAGVTPSAALLAAFARIVAAWSATSHFTLNLTLFQRLPLHPDVDRLVGEFTCLTLLETRAPGTEAFAEIARAVQRQLAADLEHQLVSGVEVLREINRARGSRERVIVPVVFTSTLALGDDDGDEADAPLWSPDDVVFGVGQTPQVWLDCQVMQYAGDLLFWWDVVDDLFPAGLIDDMFEAFHGLVGALAAGEGLWSRAVPDVRPDDQRRRHAAANATASPVAPAALHDAFLAQARSTPDALAVAAGDHRLTYAELERQSHALAARLAASTPLTDRVAVVMEKGWEQVVAVLACVRAGFAYVPIDPSLPRERLAYMLRDAAVDVVVTQPELESLLPQGAAVCAVALDGLQTRAVLPPLSAIAPDRAAYVIYTSGSTGAPKGVVIEHDSAWNTIADVNRRLHVSSGDRVLAVSSLAFDLSVYDIFGALAAGAAVVVPPAEAVQDGAALGDLVLDRRITIWNSVPSLAQVLADDAERRDRALPSLRALLLSGDWIPVDLVARLRRVAPNAEIISLGGATECSIWSAAYPIERIAAGEPSVPYGRPLANQTVHVLDAGLCPRPDWVPGDLYIGGRGLAREYWGQPDRTRASFVLDSRTGERLYRTGDRACYLPDGNLRFLGRSDTQVKIHGHRVELGEIETVLGEHPDVASVAAVVQSGSGAKQIAAHVVMRESPPVPLSDDARWAALRSVAASLDGLRARTSGLWGGPSGPPLHEPGVSSAARTLRELLSDFTASAAVDALARIGGLGTGEFATAGEIQRRGGIEARYARWLDRILALAAAENGPVERSGESYRLREAASLRWAALAERIEDVIDIEIPAAGDRRGAREWLGMYRQIVAALPRLLTGEASQIDVVFPDGTEARASALLGRGFGAAHGAVRHALAALLVAGPARRLRVLEVGAGVGSLTEELVPILTPDVEYVFTDVSRFFTERARARWAASTALQFARFDVERAPEAQGFDAGSVDVVLAADVLHATRRVRETLRNLCRVLAPGGVLILVEHTRFEPYFNLDMGLAQGFDRFDDRDLRPVHPLLTSEQWLDAARGAGFVDGVVLDDGRSRAELARIEAIAARAGGRQPSPVGPLRAFAASRLPAYMVPHRFVVHASLPLTAQGKIDRATLAALEPESIPAPAGRAAPLDPLEDLVASAWCEALGRDAVEPDAGFFELGGDSLIATRIVSRLRQAFEGELSLRAFFEAGTVRRLTAHLRAARRAASFTRVLPQVWQPGDTAPLSFAQERVWAHEQVMPGTGAYSMVGAYRIDGSADVDRIRRAIEGLVARHEALRTTIETRGEEPVQVVAPAGDAAIEERPMRADGDAGQVLVALATEAASGTPPWDLARGPLFRVQIVRDGRSASGIVLSVHHICADAWSIGVLARDFAALYDAGRAQAPPPLPLRYRDFAVWQRHHLRDDVLGPDLRYWTEALAPLAPSPFGNATSHARPDVRLHRHPLSPHLADEARRASRSAGVSLFTVLLAAFDAAVVALTGRREFTIGTSVANRTRGETDDVVGMFVNILPLRVALAEDATAAAFVRTVDQRVVGALTHQDCPLEKIAEAVGAPRHRPAGTPLVDTLFVYESVPVPSVAPAGFALAPVDLPVAAGRFDLNFHVRQTACGFDLSVSYDAARHATAVVERLAGAYVEALGAIVRRPDAPLGTILDDIAAFAARAESDRLHAQRLRYHRRLLERAESDA